MIKSCMRIKVFVVSRVLIGCWLRCFCVWQIRGGSLEEHELIYEVFKSWGLRGGCGGGGRTSSSSGKISTNTNSSAVPMWVYETVSIAQRVRLWQITPRSEVQISPMDSRKKDRAVDMQHCVLMVPAKQADLMAPSWCWSIHHEWSGMASRLLWRRADGCLNICSGYYCELDRALVKMKSVFPTAAKQREISDTIYRCWWWETICDVCT